MSGADDQGQRSSSGLGGSAGSADRELLAVLVALEPLDDRKWSYLDLRRRTFDADGMLDEPLSSGERVLVETAASLWNTGKVDLGYIANALGGRHLQAVIDALAIRAGRELTSDTDRAVARIGDAGPRRTPKPIEANQRAIRAPDRSGPERTQERPGLER